MTPYGGSHKNEGKAVTVSQPSILKIKVPKEIFTAM